MFLRFNLFTFLWAGVIFLLILMPGQQMPKVGDLFSFDKLAHSGVFGILNFLMIVGFSKQFTYPKLKQNPFRYGMVISTVYAGILELGQSIIPDRYANYQDMAFNLAGILIGGIFFLLIYKYSFN